MNDILVVTKGMAANLPPIFEKRGDGEDEDDYYVRYFADVDILKKHQILQMSCVMSCK